MYHAIVAKLTEPQKAKIRNWAQPHYPRSVDYSDQAFGGKKTRQTHELTTKPKPPHPAVENFLLGHNYNVNDYAKGLASHKDTPTRQIKIGKLLEKHQAPPEIKKIFANDPARAANRAPNLHVTYSRSPYDVASASTDRGWTSCISMNKKPGRVNYSDKYLPKDLEHGTIVAYLHHHNDPTLSNPLARISIKKAVSPEGDTIMRPEDTTYGSETPEFREHVNNWAKHHFPPMPNTLYSPHPDLYADSKKNHTMHVTDIGQAVKNYNPKHNPHAFLDALSSHVDDEDDTEPNILNHPGEITPKHVTSEKLNRLLNNSRLGRQLLSKHGSPELLNKLSKSPQVEHVVTAAKSKKLDKKDAIRLAFHEHPAVQRELAKHTPHEEALKKILQHPHSTHAKYLAESRLNNGMKLPEDEHEE